MVYRIHLRNVVTLMAAISEAKKQFFSMCCPVPSPTKPLHDPFPVTYMSIEIRYTEYILGMELPMLCPVQGLHQLSIASQLRW